MEKTNQVYLNGHVGSCIILRRDEQETVAGLRFYTFIPKENAPENGRTTQRFDHMEHKVRVVAVGPDGDRLLDIERMCAKDPRIHPYELRGILRELEDGSSIIDCRMEDLWPTDGIETNPEINNVTKISGSVVQTSYTDRYAKVLLDTGEGNVTVWFPKETFEEAWNVVKEGRMVRGTMLSLEGPLLSREYTDGKTRFVQSVLTPHIMEQEKLAKKQRHGARRRVG